MLENVYKALSLRFKCEQDGSPGASLGNAKSSTCMSGHADHPGDPMEAGPLACGESCEQHRRGLNACSYMCIEVDHAPRFAELLSKRVHYKVTTWLGEFGGKSPKCIKLWSSDPFIQHLHRTGLDTSQKAMFQTPDCQEATTASLPNKVYNNSSIPGPPRAVAVQRIGYTQELPDLSATLWPCSDLAFPAIYR